ncbi:hypothetical protein [uncultured Polaribacter sp.]|uniref:hypothetical protein n=1 Tax=uncultured Polaribacter sp. TaxID=174711 RepID=UPI002622C6FD|nr:hypothetical protein [uncultured Polaribacter sp.]
MKNFKKIILINIYSFFCITTLYAQKSKIADTAVYKREINTNSLRHSKLDTLIKNQILYTDLDKDGDPDIIELNWKGKRLRWFDENDNATMNDKWGDMINDALQVDMDNDGFYDGPADYNVKWADRDADGIPDIQIFSRNPKVGANWVFGKSGAIYFVMIDPDNTGLLTDIEWNDLSVSWTRFDKGPNWRTNYHGNATFLKEHAPIWSVENPSFTWENPFLFYDFDEDGLSEMSIRVADNRIFDKKDRNKLSFDGIVDEAWVSYDLDNDSGRDNEMDYDMTLYVAGALGLNYKDQVHHIPEVKAPNWVLPYYRHSKWRQQTEFIYLKREGAVNRLFSATWARAFLTVDEDDDSHRWERVEIYYPGNPYILKRYNKNSPIYHPQSDALGDRGEWDLDFSGKAKLYQTKWDGKIHLLGAEKGAWTVDRNRAFWAGAHPNEVASTKMPDKVEEVIQYEDTNNNGFFDKITYDYNGDGQSNRTDSLLALGINDVGEILDVTTHDWNKLRLHNSAFAKENWQSAQRLFRTAFKYGLVDASIIKLSKASSVQEKYINGYWLKEEIIRKILAIAPEKNHKEFLKAYYQSDIIKMEKLIFNLKISKK